MTGYLGNLDFLEEFLIRCGEEGLSEQKSSGLSSLEFEKRRKDILDNTVKELKAVRLNDTDIPRYFKNKRVLRITHKDTHKEK